MPRLAGLSLLLAISALVTGSARAQLAPNAAPTGGQVVAGTASIGQTPAATIITQASDRAAIDWRGFDVGARHRVDFNQPGPGALTLNRVVGPDPSEIAGRIHANGQLVIVNQSGITFDNGSEVDATALVATTADITNRNFMQGRMAFDRAGNPNAAVRNSGSITVRGRGLAALVAPVVANAGSITAKLGHVVLAGGATETLDLYGDGLVSINVTRQVKQLPVGPGGQPVAALVTNSGVVRADGGSVTLTATAVDGLVQTLVNAGGTVIADTAGGHAGRIVVAGEGGSLVVSGTLAADGTAGRRGGQIQVAGPGDVLLGGTARISASGGAGRTGRGGGAGRAGGTVAIGTTLARAKGGPSARASVVAANVTAAAGATISADAIAAGDGGRITLLSRGMTSTRASISARGAGGGSGGAVEISGGSIGAVGAVDASAQGGRLGSILLDPGSLTIATGGNPVVGSGTTFTTDTVIAPTALNALRGNIVLTADDTIAIDNAITLTHGQSLTLTADNDDPQPGVTTAFDVLAAVTTRGSISFTAKSGDIVLDAPVTSTSVAKSGAVMLKATAGAIVVDAALTSSGGHGVTLRAGGDIVAGDSITASTGAATLTAGSAFTQTGGTLSGQSISIAADGGPLDFGGVIQGGTGPGDTVTLSAMGGGVNEQAAGSIGQLSATTLVASATSAGESVMLDGAHNAVETLGGASTAANRFVLRSGTGLTVASTALQGVTAPVSISIASAGAITVSQTLAAGAGGVSLAAGGDIGVDATLSAAGGGVSLQAGGGITVNDAIAADGGEVNLSTVPGSGDVSLGADLRGIGVSITSGGDITQTAGSMTASGSISLVAAGNITQDSAGSIGGDPARSSSPATVSLSAGGGTGIGFAGFVGGAGVTLEASAGSVAELVSGSTRHGRLDATTLTVAASAGSVTLDGVNHVRTLAGPSTALGQFELTDISKPGLTVASSGMQGGTAPNSISISNAGALTIGGSLAASGGSVALTTTNGGAITQTAGSITSATTITLSAVGDIVQDAPGDIDGGTVALTTGGAAGISFAGFIGGSNVTLSALAGSVTEQVGGLTGRLSAGTLTASAPKGSVTLTGSGNAVAALGGASAASAAFALADAMAGAGLSIASTALQGGTAPNSISITNTGDIDIAAPITAGAGGIVLDAGGDITQAVGASIVSMGAVDVSAGGGGGITVGDLIQGSPSVTLDARGGDVIEIANGRIHANTLVLHAQSAALDADDNVFKGLDGLAIEQQLSLLDAPAGGVLTITGDSGVTAAQGMTFSVGGSLAIDGALRAAHLDFETSGAVTEDSAATLQAALLTGNAGLAEDGVAGDPNASVTLTAGANAISYLGPYNQAVYQNCLAGASANQLTGNFQLVDSVALTVSGLVYAGQALARSASDTTPISIALAAPTLSIDDTGAPTPFGASAGQLYAYGAGTATPGVIFLDSPSIAIASAGGVAVSAGGVGIQAAAGRGIIALQTDQLRITDAGETGTVVQADDGWVAITPDTPTDSITLQYHDPSAATAGALVLGLDSLSHVSTLPSSGTPTAGLQVLQLGATPIPGTNLAGAVVVDTSGGRIDLTGIATTLQLNATGDISEVGGSGLAVTAVTGMSGGTVNLDLGQAGPGANNAIAYVGAVASVASDPFTPGALLGLKAAANLFLSANDGDQLTVIGLAWAGAGETLELQAPSLVIDGSGTNGRNGSLLATYVLDSGAVLPGHIQLQADSLEMLGQGVPVVNAPAGVVAIAPWTDGLAMQIDPTANAAAGTLSIAAADLGLINTTRDVDLSAIGATLGVTSSALVTSTIALFQTQAAGASAGPSGTQVLELGALDGATQLAGSIAFDTNLDLTGGTEGPFGGVANSLALFAQADVTEAAAVGIRVFDLVGNVGGRLLLNQPAGSASPNTNSFASLGASAAPVDTFSTGVVDGFHRLTAGGAISVESTQALWNADLLVPAGAAMVQSGDSVTVTVLSAGAPRGIDVFGEIVAANNVTLTAGSDAVDGQITVEPGGEVVSSNGGAISLLAGLGGDGVTLNPDAVVGVNDILIEGSLSAGSVQLTAAGDIAEADGGVIGAGSLNGRSGGATDLFSPDNAVGSLSFASNVQFDRDYGFDFFDSEALSVLGVSDYGSTTTQGVLISVSQPSPAGAGAPAIDIIGTISTATTNTNGGVVLSTNGAILEEASGSIATRELAAGAGFNPITNTLQRLAGSLPKAVTPLAGTPAVDVNLLGGANQIAQLGVVEATGSIFLSDQVDLTTTDRVLAGATASGAQSVDIETFAAAPGGSASLTVDALIETDGGNITLRAGGLDRAGSVTLTAGPVTTGSLTAASASGQVLITAGVDPAADSAMATAAADPGCTEATCAISIGDKVNANGVVLLAGGSIDESGGIVANTLAGQAGGRAVLLGGAVGAASANRVGTLQGFASNLTFDDPAGLVFRDGEAAGMPQTALTVTGSVSDGGASQSSGVQLIVARADLETADLVIDGTISTVATNSLARVDLEASGMVSDTGAISTALLTAQAGIVPSTEADGGARLGTGSVSLSSTGNAIGTLGNISAGGNVSVVDGANPLTGPAGAITVAGSIRAGLDAGGAASSVTISSAPAAGGTLAVTGSVLAGGTGGTGGGWVSLVSGGALSLAGSVTAAPGTAQRGTVTLTSAGATSETGTISANLLVGSAGSGGASLSGRNAVANLGAYTSGGAFALTDATALSVGAAVSAAGTLAITDSATGGLRLAGQGTLTAIDPPTLSPTIVLNATAGGLTLGQGSSVTATGAIGTVLLEAAGSIQAAGTVSAQAGIVMQAGGGATDGGTGLLRTGVLSGTVGGQFSFLGQDNSVGAVSNFQAGTAFALRDGAVTTIANVQAGRSFMLEAGAAVTLSGQFSAPVIVVDDPNASVTLSGDTILTGFTRMAKGQSLFTEWPTASLTGPGGGAFITAAGVTQTGLTSVGAVAGAAGATLRIDLTHNGAVTFADLVAPGTNLYLNLAGPAGTGVSSALGAIDVKGLYVNFDPGAPSSVSLTGQIDGVGGQQAAGEAFITPVRNRSYEFNACAIQSVNCILLSPVLVPPINPIQAYDLTTGSESDDDLDLLLPNVGETDY
jgi:filamentous hemagglutinin family protein